MGLLLGVLKKLGFTYNIPILQCIFGIRNLCISDYPLLCMVYDFKSA